MPGNHSQREYITAQTSGEIEEVVYRTITALKKYGFKVLVELNVSAVLKKEMDVNIYPYRILSIFHPELSLDALQIEDKIATIMPSSVIIQGKAGDITEVAAENPEICLEGLDQKALEEIACDFTQRLKWALSEI